jgi:hypothetical protein
VIEEAGSEVKGTILRAQIPQRHHGPLLSWGCRALPLATLCTHGAFGCTTRLLFGWMFGSSHRGRYDSIVGFYPSLHAFRGFHIPRDAQRDGRIKGEKWQSW